MEKRMRIAIYLRLSKEDGPGRAGESGSIRMQRALLEKYVGEHFTYYELQEFMDDGYSGTNLNRPGMTALLAAVRRNEIDCILVKDFSRFSRDYIDLGTYVGQVFPFMKVRFISVNDRFDSIERENGVLDLGVSFQHLLYDLYSKDLSVKVKASLEIKKARGEYVGPNPPFGYGKASEDRHMLCIVEEEAAVVRRIFSMTADGMTSSQIARHFNREGVKTPLGFRQERGKRIPAPKGGQLSWNNTTVCAILRNPVYTGDLVYGKYGRDCVGGKACIRPKEEWKILRDHHEPIIERETFEKIQGRKRGGGRRKTGKRGEERKHPLVGKLICGCCKRTLSYRGKRANPYFYCNNRYTNGQEGCVKEINALLAEEIILFRLQEKGMESKDGQKGKEKRAFRFQNLPFLTYEAADAAVREAMVMEDGEMKILWKEDFTDCQTRPFLSPGLPQPPD